MQKFECVPVCIIEVKNFKTKQFFVKFKNKFILTHNRYEFFSQYSKLSITFSVFSYYRHFLNKFIKKF
jgi:hypothetical protein